MVRLRLVVAYDGGPFAGWQAQRSGTAVQEVLERALDRIMPGASRLNSSSRTDAGVHALGMVAHVDVPGPLLRMTGRKLVLALNAHLPETVRVRSVSRASPRFHARFDARAKEYRYQVWNDPAAHPLLRHMAWHVPKPLDLDRMREAARQFLGRHDFKSFAGTRHYEMESTCRTVLRCDIRKSGPLITWRIEGDGFLYKMCRGLVGTMVQCGLGKFPPSDIAVMLGCRDRRMAGMTAPAHGLILWKVHYPRGGSR